MICSSVYLLFFMSVILHGLTDFANYRVVRAMGGRSKQLIQDKTRQVSILGIGAIGRDVTQE